MVRGVLSKLNSGVHGSSIYPDAAGLGVPGGAYRGRRVAAGAAAGGRFIFILRPALGRMSWKGSRCIHRL